MDGKFKKVFQKRLYDLLSHKYGILTIVVGVFLLSISAFHFGEAWLEWSKEKYEVVFHSFSDNIGGKSFRERLSLPVPIDVVYTWVNGSDPDTKRQLDELKFHMQKETNLTRGAACSYLNCLAVGVVVLPALPDTVSLSDLQSKEGYGTIFSNVTSLVQMRLSPDVPANLTLLFQDHDVTPLTHHFEQGWSFQGTNYSVQPAYYTSDTTLTHGMSVSLLVMVTGFPSSGYTTEKLESALATHLGVDAGLDLTVNWDKGLALLKASDKTQFDSAVNKNNATIEGKVLKLAPVTLVWDLLATKQDNEVADYRFQDKEELRYSLRSLERFAPWIRHVFIVTNGQIPYWLNMDNPRLTVVTHTEIFANESHLPTFSSPAIEANLHRIPGLSKKFLYLNDDVMFGVPVWPDDFFSHATGHKVYLAWPVPNCNEGCPSTWINDGYCDKACNSTECDWDGGDCVGEKGKQVQLGAGFHGGQGMDYNAEDAYCHGGCANSWLSDKYCDQSCNNLDCGFDAGDCGVEHYDQLHDLKMEPGAQKYELPTGEHMGYFNLTDLLGEEGKVTSARYGSDSAVRAAAVSNKYKVMTLLIFKGRNKTEVLFDLEYKKDNETFKVNFTVTMDTMKPKVLPPMNQKLEGFNPNRTHNNETEVPQKEKTEEERQDELDAVAFTSVHKDNLRQAKMMTEKPPVPEVSLGAMGLELDVLTYYKHLNLSLDLEAQLVTLNKAKGQGDLTDLGLKRKLRNIFSNFKQELVAVMPKLAEVKSKNTSKEGQQSDKNVQENKDTQGMEVKIDDASDSEKANVDGKPVDEKKKVLALEKLSNVTGVKSMKQDGGNEPFKDLVDKKVKTLKSADKNDKGVFKDLKQDSKKADSNLPNMDGKVKRANVQSQPENVGNDDKGVKKFKRSMKNWGDKKVGEDSIVEIESKDDGGGGGVDDVKDELKVHGPGRKLLSFIPASYWKNKFQVAQEKRALRNREMRKSKMDEDEYLQLVSVESAGDSVHPMPWEEGKMEESPVQDMTRDKTNRAYIVDGWQGRRLLDAFGDSLRHVNQLYNREFGFTARKALAHMPHLIDREIMAELQDRFHAEWEATSSHQIRHPRDMQFAFAYYYYVMGVTVPTTPSQVFDDIDTDKSSILSDRELRTLTTKLYELPLYLEVLTGLETMLINCSHELEEKHRLGLNVTYTVPETTQQKELEVYYDKNMPQVTKELFLNCDPLLELVKKHFTPQHKYKTTVMDDQDVAFKIIHSNVSKVVGQLDDIRKNPKKYICLNDNMDHSIEEAKTVTAVLQDFYESVLPIPSQFELPRDYRNRFLHMDQLREWRSYRDWLQFWTHFALAVLIIFTIMSFLGDKIESLTRRISRRLYRRSPSPSSGSSSPSLCSSSSSSSTSSESPDLHSPDEASVFLSGVETV